MKKQLLFSALFLICSFTVCTAQSITPTVIATQGDYYSSSGGTVSWTLGEVVTETATASGNILTQGFQQPKLMISTNVSNPEPLLSVTPYPNPVLDKLILDFSNSTSGNYTLEIFDMQGKKLSNENFSFLSSSVKQHTLSFSNYANGFYVLTVINSDKNFKKSFKINKTL